MNNYEKSPDQVLIPNKDQIPPSLSPAYPYTQVNIIILLKSFERKNNNLFLLKSSIIPQKFGADSLFSQNMTAPFYNKLNNMGTGFPPTHQSLNTGFSYGS
jgi:hypothetical protein